MSESEERLAKQLSEIQELAKERKDIDVATLMFTALESQQRNLVPLKQKRAAYMLSLLLPPFGLLIAVKYLLSDEDDAHHVAYACIGITFASVVIALMIARSMFAGAHITPEQVEGLKPAEIIQMTP